MKDLIFSDVEGNEVARFRAEMLVNDPANISVLEIRNAEGVQQDYIVLGVTKWQKLAYSWTDILNFCIDSNYSLVSKDTDGENEVTVIEASGDDPDPEPEPEPEQYLVVSAEGDTKTFLIEGDVTDDFASGDSVTLYDSSDESVGTYEVVSSSYESPNTSVVVAEVISDIAEDSGSYLVVNA